MSQLCQGCFKAVATERCVMCGRVFCRSCYSGSGLCKGCRFGKQAKGMVKK